MREFRTSGSVGGRGGLPPGLPDNGQSALQEPLARIGARLRMPLTPGRRPAAGTARLRGRTGPCYSRCVLLPFKRDRLRARNAVDEAEDRADSALRSPAERS